MRYVRTFLASALVTCLLYYVAVATLIDAPIAAEYWVGEMITVKKELAKKYSENNKVVIAGGSNALFGVDAEYMSSELGVPVVNFGLHAGLRLGKILDESGALATRGDSIVLMLEAAYFDCNQKPNKWQVENVIGWDHDSWRRMGFIEKAEFVTFVSPGLLVQMVIAGMQRRYHSASIQQRLISLDDSLVLTKFQTRAKSTHFRYSAYNLGDHGDILHTEGAKYAGPEIDAREPRLACRETAKQLAKFVDRMKMKGVRVCFANTPYLCSKVSGDEVRKSERSFENDFASVGAFIDKRVDLLLERKYFFDTPMHLNAEGRTLRTRLLIDAIRKNLPSEDSGQRVGKMIH